MAVLTAEEVTNLYLYGQKTVPSDLTAESLIRGIKETAKEYVDINAYMADAGRFASPASFELIEKFFTTKLPVGNHKKEFLTGYFGMDKIFLSYQQYSYRDDINDYFERVYIWNSVAFKIDDRAIFHVEEDGTKWIENFAIVPHSDTGTENFDFESDDGFAIIGNPILRSIIDPSGIGRTVKINFTGTINTTTFTYEDYLKAVENKPIEISVDYTELILELKEGIYQLTDQLFASGSTRTLFENKPIIYGTQDNDVLNEYEVANPNLHSLEALLYSPGGIDTHMHFKDYAKNGIVYVGGGGNDKIDGTEYEDILYGGTGNDELYGGKGADKLFGGTGDDELDGGEGADILNGSSGFDTYIVTDGDVIKDDEDGKGKVKFYGLIFDTLMEGGDEIKDKPNTYKGKHDEIYTLEGTTLKIEYDNKTITIENFDNTKKDGYLGITLGETALVSISGSGLSFTASLDKVLDYDVKVSYDVTSGSQYIEDTSETKGSVIIKAGSASASIVFKDLKDNTPDDCCTSDPSKPVDFTLSLSGVEALNIPEDTKEIKVNIDSEHKEAKGQAWFDGDDTDCIGNCGCGCTKVVPEVGGSNGRNFCSPLILDLNNNGTTSISLAASSVFFDADANGFKEKTAWIENSDALLTLDINNNGIIDNGLELFGNHTKLSNGNTAKDGFEALRDYDINKDGVIDAKDSIYNNLKVWIDANSDAKTDEGELQTLKELGITSINVNANRVNIPENDNIISHTSSFMQDGTVKEINDVWFLQSPQNSQYDYDKQLSYELLSFPNLTGGGIVMNLRDSMNEDNILKDLVKSLISKTSSSTYSDFTNSFKDMIARWSKTDSIDPNLARGEQRFLNHNYDNPTEGRVFHVYAYARDIAILEAFGGENFSMIVDGKETNEAIGMQAGEMINESLHRLLSRQTMLFLNEILYGGRFYEEDYIKTAELLKQAASDLVSQTSENKNAYSLLISSIVDFKGLDVLEKLDGSILNNTSFKSELEKHGILYNIDNNGNIYGTYNDTMVLNNDGVTVTNSGVTIGGDGNDTFPALNYITNINNIMRLSNDNKLYR